MVVSPDIGGVARARKLAESLHVPLAIIDKRRPKPNVAEIMHIIGEVKGRRAIMIDDMIDTAGDDHPWRQDSDGFRRQGGICLLYSPGAVRAGY